MRLSSLARFAEGLFQFSHRSSQQFARVPWISLLVESESVNSISMDSNTMLGLFLKSFETEDVFRGRASSRPRWDLNNKERFKTENDLCLLNSLELGNPSKNAADCRHGSVHGHRRRMPRRVTREKMNGCYFHSIRPLNMDMYCRLLFSRFRDGEKNIRVRLIHELLSALWHWAPCWCLRKRK